MLVILFLLFLVAMMVAFYAQANSGTHDITLFGTHWSGVYEWIPVVLGVAAASIVCLAAIGYGMFRIRSLKQANAALRAEMGEVQTEVTRLKLERAAAAEMARRDIVGRPAAREPSPWREREAVREPAPERAAQVTASTAPARSPMPTAPG
jgi:uncharacterized membrane protein